ncbi:efflux transporter outer membrane subunit [Novosphingobium sp. 9]|uniref:efflux transporter outer membrane subunit n=1 Tax=Novosphingobium sp. 9 TaxID=2025349 RepID=UPI0021B58D38|nr:efflux transporter outer membrane subunit [Novosphingobium sp. 9]
MMNAFKLRAACALSLTACLLAGCAVGPNYHRPSAPEAPRFKEADGWVPSRPADDAARGPWWTMFNDPVLDGLEDKVATSNQTVKEYEAAWREAAQTTAAARATLFPTVGADLSSQRTHTSGAASSSGQSSTGTTHTAALDASWVPDLWGQVRRNVESDKALAEASSADLADAKLAAQASLAQDYFELRVLDEQAGVYRRMVEQYQRFLTLTTNQFNAGTVAQSSVISAKTQLYAAQASLVDLGVRRAAMEHAIAVLMGMAPAQFSLAPAPLSHAVPVAPVSLPSTLLERRPDIAAAERRMASANALVGVAVASYFPTVTLSGEYGSSAGNLGKLFGAATSLWSLGADVADTIFDFGARHAKEREAKAAYDQSVATYRQTVLTAFQGVEDELAALRVYQQESDILVHTQDAAHQAVVLDMAEYQQGTVDYTTVLTAQATELTASQNVLTVLQDRLQASVLLVEDLGGGWQASDMKAS